ncbi:FMN-binding protein, partial [Nostoc sp. NIES-2111]
YGPVQVQVSVSGGRITAVDVLQYPDSSGKDQRINSQAIPQLVDETLSAQSSRIDMVSGATYTSEGYVTSLQSALDRAGLPS